MMCLTNTAILNRPSTGKLLNLKERNLPITICEDIWNLGDNPLYRICPMDILMQQQAGCNAKPERFTI
jgi:hypothetical protein